MALKTTRRHNTAARYVLLIAGAALMVSTAVFHQYIATVLSGVVAFATTPAESAYQGLPRSVLAARLADAEASLTRIRYQAFLYAEEVERNRELTALLNLPMREGYAHGTVIARPPRTHYDTLLVSVAEGTRVAVGDEVLAFDVALGTVSDVRGTTVLVTLYSSPGTTLDVRVGDPTAITVMHGLGAGSVTFEVPKEVALQPGDVVRTAHAERTVAVVQRIIEEPERTTVTVYAAAPVASADMRTVDFVRTPAGVFEE